MSSHPLQSQIWTSIILRPPYSERKPWAIDLGEEPSTITRWSTGERPMGPGDWQRVVIVLERDGRHDDVGRIRRLWITAVFGESSDEPVAPADASPYALALDSARMAGRDADTIERAISDGDLDADDAPSFDTAAEAHEATARKFRQLAMAAREGRTLRAVGGAR
jgi:hypothetical protein